ncbi:DUF1853 family protein [Ferrimonas marina]|uniref:DUF1853 domain-containing protein n=1 Tax=Ferrimonas marina TaxID=299255 RepID=A0A1M5NK52_9GAMM|nr:DUF1853 family protein [Ferrimonas marina]SHG89569.1 hypothetical protein SAMN02745129_1076 [Ferrimonas marina]
MPIPLRHPILRDLHWILTQPPMVDQAPTFFDHGFLKRFAQPLLPRLHRIEQECLSVLVRFKRHGRLGFYYEQLWQLALDLHPDYQVLARDWPVKRDKQTLGALDLLVRHRPSGSIEHWELAVKFFLGVGDLRDPHRWIGPGQKDRLGDKLTRLISHQLPLVRRDEAQIELAKQGWTVSHSRALVQGRLYAPAGASTVPQQIHPHALQGHWYPQSALPQRPWRVLSRFDWLAGRPWQVLPRFAPPDPITWPVHLWDPSGAGHAFVVPEQWAANAGEQA